MALPEFLNGYTFASLYSRVLYAHIMYKKLLRVSQKTMLCQQKLFHIEATLRIKIYKKICCGNNKNYVTPKRETHV